MKDKQAGVAQLVERLICNQRSLPCAPNIHEKSTVCASNAADSLHSAQPNSLISESTGQVSSKEIAALPSDRRVA